MRSASQSLDDAEVVRLRLVAEHLTQGTSFGRPEDASDPEVGLRRALDLRPDLVAPLRDVLGRLGDEPARGLPDLPQADPLGWAALVACVFGGALTRPDVRRAIGYPGQEGRVIRAEDFTRWVEAGLLDPVLERGPVWRRPGG